LAGLGILLVSAASPAKAQHGWEFGVQAIGAFADFDFAGGGLWGGWRPGGSTRIGVSLMPGAIDGEFAGRAEVTAQFLLSPASLRRGLYAGGGLAGLTGPNDAGYLLFLLGYESKPGGASGWVIEGGIGGGVRVLLGYRWRWVRR
jgi:hypothetical protein